MKTFQGRKTKLGQWVAFGPHDELIHELMWEREVRIELPRRSHVTPIARVGAPFQHGDEIWAYGYPAIPIPIKTARPLNRSRRPVKRSPVTARAIATVTAPDRSRDRAGGHPVTAPDRSPEHSLTDQGGLW